MRGIFVFDSSRDRKHLRSTQTSPNVFQSFFVKRLPQTTLDELHKLWCHRGERQLRSQATGMGMELPVGDKLSACIDCKLGKMTRAPQAARVQNRVKVNKGAH
jgi:hypothetical protein